MHQAVKIAEEAAAAGASVITTLSGSITNVRAKGSPTDYVSDVDIQAGVAAVRAIVARDRSAHFVVEEPEVYELAAVDEGSLTDDLVWLIDPLDGTTSFLHGYPCYSVSVALLAEGKPVAGAVWDVPTGKLASASIGVGATLDGRPIRCTDAAALTEALLITGFPYDRGRPLDKQLEVLGRFLRAPVHGIRRDGSAALDCVHVAAGRADGFWEFGLKPWDTAAGAVILAEAGARATGIDGEDWSVASSGIIAANPALHARMLEIIQSSGEPGPQGGG